MVDFDPIREILKGVEMQRKLLEAQLVTALGCERDHLNSCIIACENLRRWLLPNSEEQPRQEAELIPTQRTLH
jgi:hypothetical protein